MTDADFYERAGGEAMFRALVQRFYDGVATDETLAPMYPADDMAGAQERLSLFLMQYWGGPTTYSEARGHPRLRMRHAPFEVNLAAHDAWLRHMRAALDSLDLEADVEERLWTYLQMAAASMRNTPG